MIGAGVPPVPAGEQLGELVIGDRYNGPETSANGGYACGSLARFLPEPAEVTLRLPPPLERALAVVADGEGGVRLLDGDAVVAEGRAVEQLEAAPPVRPSFEQAAAATAEHPWRGVRHALSDCFVCGPARGEPGDGLGVSPGPLAGHDDDVGAASFVPDESVADDGIVRPEVVWASLDCPSFTPSMWTSGQISLLGRLAAVRGREIQVGERLAVVGWKLATEGRKHQTASALIDANGEVVARARATWIELRGGGAGLGLPPGGAL
jgi:hypothetical protein